MDVSSGDLRDGAGFLVFEEDEGDGRDVARSSERARALSWSALAVCSAWLEGRVMFEAVLESAPCKACEACVIEGFARREGARWPSDWMWSRP